MAWSIISFLFKYVLFCIHFLQYKGMIYDADRDKNELVVTGGRSGTIEQYALAANEAYYVVDRSRAEDERKLMRVPSDISSWRVYVIISYRYPLDGKKFSTNL